MTHVEQGELQAYLDGEVTAGSRAQIEAHIHGCATCTAELDALRAASTTFAFAMRGSDALAPTAAALAAVSAARGDVARRRFALSRSALSKAAIFLIGFAALASAAIPGSPIRKWISSKLKSPEPPAATATAPVTAPSVPEAAPAASTESAGQAALSIEPTDGRVVVTLTNVATDAVIRVRLVDGDRAVVQATKAAAHARFRTGAGRIDMVNVGAGEVTIDLPRNIASALVQADGRVIFQR